MSALIPPSPQSLALEPNKVGYSCPWDTCSGTNHHRETLSSLGEDRLVSRLLPYPSHYKNEPLLLEKPRGIAGALILPYSPLGFSTGQ